jgi:hypothetical protein
MAMHVDEGVQVHTRDAKLLPVVLTIVGLYVCIMAGSYFLGNYVL